MGESTEYELTSWRTHHTTSPRRHSLIMTVVVYIAYLKTNEIPQISVIQLMLTLTIRHSLILKDRLPNFMPLFAIDTLLSAHLSTCCPSTEHPSTSLA